jgi:hypothetical protein
MDEEEMYDVNGGFFWGSGVSRFWTGVAIDGAIIAAGIGAAGVSLFKAIKLLKAGRTYIRTNIAKFVLAAGYSLASSLYGGIMFAVGLISNINSLGSLIAHALDYADGNYNGKIRF